MKNKSKANIILLISILIIAVVWVMYCFVINPEPTEEVNNSENSSAEIFNRQPGEIKSITSQGNNQWSVAVDLLSPNPQFLPGVTDFFINQNTKIRNLVVTPNTRTYKCGKGLDGNETSSDVLVPTLYFINRLQDGMNEGGIATAYFDIKGTDIIAIYEQCLP